MDNAAEKAKKSITEGGKLTTELAIPLMLKSQFNHIAHLEEQMVTKKEFNNLKEQFSGLKEQMVTKTEFNSLKEQVGFMKWMIMCGFALLVALHVYTSFIR